MLVRYYRKSLLAARHKAWRTFAGPMLCLRPSVCRSRELPAPPPCMQSPPWNRTSRVPCPYCKSPHQPMKIVIIFGLFSDQEGVVIVMWLALLFLPPNPFGYSFFSARRGCWLLVLFSPTDRQAEQHSNPETASTGQLSCFPSPAFKLQHLRSTINRQ
jgi:hypothetical protein